MVNLIKGILIVSYMFFGFVFIMDEFLIPTQNGVIIFGGMMAQWILFAWIRHG